MATKRVAGATSVKGQFQWAVDYLELRGPIWQERMGLSHVEIEHHYLDASSDLVLGSHPKNRPGVVRCSYGSAGNLQYTAFVETRWNYQTADVYFFLPSAIQWDLPRIDQICVHEYSHILCASEQYLLESKLEEIAANEQMTSGDFDIVTTLYYERMEMSTENVARAVYAGYDGK